MDINEEELSGEVLFRLGNHVVSTRSLNLINIRYNIGITNRVNTVENARPQTIAVATGPQINEVPAKPVANENKPAMVVSEVINTGITLLLAA